MGPAWICWAMDGRSLAPIRSSATSIRDKRSRVFTRYYERQCRTGSKSGQRSFEWGSGLRCRQNLCLLGYPSRERTLNLVACRFSLQTLLRQRTAAICVHKSVTVMRGKSIRPTLVHPVWAFLWSLSPLKGVEINCMPPEEICYPLPTQTPPISTP